MFHPVRVLLLFVLLGLGLVLLIGGQALYLVFATPGTFPQGPQLLMDAVESAQSPAGREKDAPDAYAALIDAHVLFSEQVMLINSRLSEAFDARGEADPDWLELIADARLREPQLDFSMIGASIDEAVSALQTDPWYDTEYEYYALVERESRAAVDVLLRAGVGERLRAISESPRATMSKPAPNAPMIGILLPELSNARQLARFCAGRMHIELERGNEDGFVQAYEDGLALARTVGVQPILISQLVRYAILSLILEEGNSAIVRGELSDDAILAMEQALRRHLPAPIDPVFGLVGERLWVLDVVHRTHTPGERGMFLPGEYQQYTWGAGAPGGARWGNALGVLAPRKDRTLASVEEAYDLLERLAAATPGERVPLYSELSDMLGTSPGIQPTLRDFLPAISRAIETGERVLSLTEGTRFMLAVEGERIRTGRLPASAGALEEAGIAVPVDATAPGREPMRVAVATGVPRGFIIYGVGADGEDNGGVPWASTSNGRGVVAPPESDTVVGGAALIEMGLEGPLADSHPGERRGDGQAREPNSP